MMWRPTDEAVRLVTDAAQANDAALLSEAVELIIQAGRRSSADV